MWIIRAVMIALVVICVIAFAFYNVGPGNAVDINLIFWPPFLEVPMVTVVFWAFVAGVMVSLLLFISVYIKLSVELRTAIKKVKALEGEVSVLRNRPIEESVDLLKGADNREEELDSPFGKSE